MIDDKTVKCITNHLTSFSMVILDSQVGTNLILRIFAMLHIRVQTTAKRIAQEGNIFEKILPCLFKDMKNC